MYSNPIRSHLCWHTWVDISLWLSVFCFQNMQLETTFKSWFFGDSSDNRSWDFQFNRNLRIKSPCRIASVFCFLLDYNSRSLIWTIMLIALCLSCHSNTERFCLQTFVSLGHHDGSTAWPKAGTPRLSREHSEAISHRESNQGFPNCRRMKARNYRTSFYNNKIAGDYSRIVHTVANCQPGFLKLIKKFSSKCLSRMTCMEASK